MYKYLNCVNLSSFGRAINMLSCKQKTSSPVSSKNSSHKDKALPVIKNKEISLQELN